MRKRLGTLRENREFTDKHRVKRPDYFMVHEDVRILL